MEISKVGRRGQITLPRDVRRTLGISEGDRVVFVQQGSEFVVKALSKTLVDMRGSVPVPRQQDWEAVREVVKEKRAARQVGTRD